MSREIMVRLKILSVLNKNMNMVKSFIRVSCIANNSNDPKKAKKALTTMMSWLYLGEFKDTDITEEEFKEVITPAIDSMVNEMVKRD